MRVIVSLEDNDTSPPDKIKLQGKPQNTEANADPGNTEPGHMASGTRDPQN